MKPASVSLAKLDEVKAKVYNIGLANAGSIKATSSSLSAKARAAEYEMHSQPPLSSVTSQRYHGW